MTAGGKDVLNVVYVALGGTFGAIARYGLGILIGSRWNYGFPLGTFLINVAGSFLLGFINVFVLERSILSPEWRFGLGVGFLGAFTTFSTFTYEALALFEEGSYFLAMAYVGSSAVVGLTAAFLGILLARVL